MEAKDYYTPEYLNKHKLSQKQMEHGVAKEYGHKDYGAMKEHIKKVSSPVKSKALEKKKESTKERHARYKKEDKFTAGMHEMNSRNHIQIDN